MKRYAFCNRLNDLLEQIDAVTNNKDTVIDLPSFKVMQDKIILHLRVCQHQGCMKQRAMMIEVGDALK